MSTSLPSGGRPPDLPGRIIPNHSVNGAAEWAYGVTDWFEQGLYLPVWSPNSEGAAGRLTASSCGSCWYARMPTTIRSYGVNFEFSVNHHYWESRRIISEVSPILEGCICLWWNFIFNPIVDTTYTGASGLGNLEFVPATRLAYNVDDKWAVAVQEYADVGPLRHFEPVHNQVHEIWAVMDHNANS